MTTRTDWVHIFVTDEDGRTGVGEATLDQHERLVVAAVDQIAGEIVGWDVESAVDVVARFGLAEAFSGLVHATVLSGIEQALWDLLGQRIGAPVHAMLGSPKPPSIRAYANLNRALIDDRSPAAFAALANRAVAEGYTAVKCAPFDGVVRARLEDRSVRALVSVGVERVAAIRRAVGDSVDVIVDCHFRLTARSAVKILPELAEWEPYWVEAPVAEHRLHEWGEVRAATSMQLGGGELITGLHRFAEFIDATGVDVIMPDIKYVGGVSGLRAIAALAASRGVAVSPHNPSGPVATIATLHASSGLPNLSLIEHAFGECDWRAALVSGAERFEDGALTAPSGPGYGFRFDTALADAHPTRVIGYPDARIRQ